MKKLILLLASLLSLAILSNGQTDNTSLTGNSSRNSIPDQVKARKSFKRVEWFNTQRAWPYDTIPVTRYSSEMSREIKKAKSNASKEKDLTWTSLGPDGVNFDPVEWGIVSGRAKTIAIHPTNPQTLYIGAAHGGIWKTTDGGQNWQDIGHGLESLAFGAIAIDPNNPETIYAGSGEVCYFLGYIGFDGKGIFKSTDGGASWTQITNGIGSVTSFGDLAVSPFNSNVVLGALASGNYYSGNLLNEGIWKSDDAGETWVRTLNVQDAYDIAFHPINANKIFAAVGGGNSASGFYISTDQGNTWVQSNTGLPSTGSMHRLQIDVSKSNPDVIYAVIFDANTMSTKAYKSVNGGQNWAQISVGTYLGGNFGDGWIDQGFYDLCIAVDPENENLVYIGNIELHRTANGSAFAPVRPYGSTAWGSICHNDYHKLVFAPSDPDYLYIACDGGIYKSPDKGYSATSQNEGLKTLQFYRVASHPTDPGFVIGGMQDNGTAMTTDGGQTWDEVTSGDGMECLFNPNPDTIYTCAQNGYFFRSINGGNTFNFIANVNGSWITPLIMHPVNHQILYTATTSILKTITGGAPFLTIASSVSPELIVSLALSPVQPNNMIFASGGTQQPVPGEIIVVKVSTDGGYNWTDVTSNIPGEPRWITRVVADPVDANTMYVLRTGFSPGNKVWKTTNLGLNWTNISGDLPDLPCSDLFIDPVYTSHLYVANDIGIYRSTDGGTSWIYVSQDIPFVPAIDFDYVKIGTDRYLRAGTHGCSIYETILPNYCLPEGITFTTQAQINSFHFNYPGCTEIEGEVTINGPNITNLNGLNEITSIGGNLIIINNDLLTNLTGLDALTYVGGYLEIGDVGDEGNPLLTSLTGLENLISTGHGLTIRFNPVLTSFDGLDNLTSLGEGGFLLIQVDDALTDLTALSNLTTIGGSLRVEYNAILTSLAGLENIDPGSIDDLFITMNPLLTSCEVQSICDYLSSPTGTVYILGNAPGCEHPADIAVACGTTFDCLPYGYYHFYSQSYIDNFHIGFPNCTVLNEYAVVFGDDITNLDGLSQITGVDGGLRIDYNPLLTDLTGLSNVTYVNDELWIQDNTILTSLAGLQNIQADSINELIITGNPVLSTCEVESICNYLDIPNSILTISNNATGCSSQQEVEDKCNGVGELEVQSSEFKVQSFPNPFSQVTTIEYKLEEAGTVNLTIFNYLGQEVEILVNEQQTKGMHQVQWDAKELPAGIYFYRLAVGGQRSVVNGKLVKY